MVATALTEGSVIGSVNLSEAVARLRHNELSEDESNLALASLQLEVVEFTHSQALQAGLMGNETRRAGLSLGDRACLALARELGWPALTGDRNWTQAQVEVHLLR